MQNNGCIGVWKVRTTLACTSIEQDIFWSSLEVTTPSKTIGNETNHAHLCKNEYGDGSLISGLDW